MALKPPSLIAPALLLAALACSGGAPTAPTATPARPPRFGVAGLIPAHFPQASAADWLALYEGLADTGGLVGVYTHWADSPEAAGAPPGVVGSAFALADRYAFTPVVGLGVWRDGPDSGARPPDWEREAGLVQQTALAVAERYRPGYLALGVEVNRYYEADPAGFERFVSVYAEVYDAVKAVSPATQVFPIFQLEYLRGGGALSGRAHAAHWELLERFGARLDLAVFTTYPFLDYAAPADLPADYYTAIADHTSRPIAFSEVGWPSAPLSAAPDSPFGGSPDEQAAFVERFFALTADQPPVFALWSFPHDVADSTAAFASVGLRRTDGTPKPALAAWQAALARSP